MKIQELIDDYITTRLTYDVAHEASSAADRAHRAAKACLVEGMQEVSNTIDPDELPLKFTLRNQFTISCNEKNEEQMKDWLHEQFGDVEEFVIPKVTKKTVVDRLKHDIEEGLLDEHEVPDFVNLKTRPDVSCSGWKAYSNEQRNYQ